MTYCAMLSFAPGVYRRPLAYAGLTGADENPLVFQGAGAPDPFFHNPADLSRTGQFPKIGDESTVFSSGLRFGDVRRSFNKVAKRVEASGQFPTLYAYAGDAMLTLSYCRNILIENIHFEDCWPTAINLDNCQRIVIRNCSFAGGTHAITARGSKTRDLLIENCIWEQDDSCRRERAHGRAPDTSGDPRAHDSIWRTFNWAQIHGDIGLEPPTMVDVEKDGRAFDGDFFRSYAIYGNVTMRRCQISRAFNAFHMHGKETGYEEIPSRNILIEENLFHEIRDNAVEPETGALNWVVRHNIFVNNHRPFAFEGERTGYFYVYGNRGANLTEPGSAGDDFRFSSLFKFNKSTKADGPTFFVHNSFVWNTDIGKKYGIDNFTFANNAIARSNHDGNLFGSRWYASAVENGVEELEKHAFTGRWRTRKIMFENNVIEAPPKPGFAGNFHFPDQLRLMGYPISLDNWGESPGLNLTGGLTPTALQPSDNSVCIGRAVKISLKFPNGTQMDISARNVGAWQDYGLFSTPCELPFIDGMFGSAVGTWTNLPPVTRKGKTVKVPLA